MNRFDKIFNGVIIGSVAPILLFLSGWWISFPFVEEKNIYIFMLGGLIAGLIVDMVFLKNIIVKAYLLKNYQLIGLYLFFSTCIYGFFMGVPVFNTAMGILAGIYMGRKMIIEKSTDINLNKKVRDVSLFTSLILFLFCISSGLIAMIDDYTALNLEGMFKLPFKVTDFHIVIMIASGTVFLVVFQYFLTYFTCRQVLKMNREI
ncbi:MAG: hypothetical protein JXQ23_11455 [Clostridia bacterium]|nr:hypothetical protein [Clostridia bacterium]